MELKRATALKHYPRLRGVGGCEKGDVVYVLERPGKPCHTMVDKSRTVVIQNHAYEGKDYKVD